MAEVDKLTDTILWKTFFVGFFSPFIAQDPEGLLLLRVGGPDRSEYRYNFGGLLAHRRAHMV